MKKIVFVCIVLMAVLSVVAYAQINRTIVITISAGLSQDVVAAYAWEYDYQEMIDGEPNPETRGQFALRMFQEQAQNNIRSTYKSYMTAQGAAAAALQADTDSLGITVQ